MNIVYLQDWSESKRDGMMDDFGITEEQLQGVEILLASYSYEDYSGSAFVLFRKDGKLFEVNGSHCSCYGLSERDYMGNSTESQWDPEETSKEALLKRLDSQSYTFDGFADVARQVFDALEA